MTHEIVLDTSVFIVSLLDEAMLNEEERKQRPLAMSYTVGLENGDYIVHLPTIAVVEIAGVIRRKAGEALATVA